MPFSCSLLTADLLLVHRGVGSSVTQATWDSWKPGCDQSAWSAHLLANSCTYNNIPCSYLEFVYGAPAIASWPDVSKACPADKCPASATDVPEADIIDSPTCTFNRNTCADLLKTDGWDGTSGSDICSFQIDDFGKRIGFGGVCNNVEDSRTPAVLACLRTCTMITEPGDLLPTILRGYRPFPPRASRSSEFRPFAAIFAVFETFTFFLPVLTDFVSSEIYFDSVSPSPFRVGKRAKDPENTTRGTRTSDRRIARTWDRRIYKCVDPTCGWF